MLETSTVKLTSSHTANFKKIIFLLQYATAIGHQRSCQLIELVFRHWPDVKSEQYLIVYPLLPGMGYPRCVPINDKHLESANLHNTWEHWAVATVMDADGYPQHSRLLNIFLVLLQAYHEKVIDLFFRNAANRQTNQLLWSHHLCVGKGNHQCWLWYLSLHLLVTQLRKFINGFRWNFRET